MCVYWGFHKSTFSLLGMEVTQNGLLALWHTQTHAEREMTELRNKPPLFSKTFPPRHCHAQQQSLQSEYLQRTAPLPLVCKIIMDSRKICFKETDVRHAEYFKPFAVQHIVFLLGSGNCTVVGRTSRETFVITLHYLLKTNQKFLSPIL